MIESHPSSFYIKSPSSKCVTQEVPGYVGHFVQLLNQAIHERYLTTHHDPQLIGELVVCVTTPTQHPVSSEGVIFTLLFINL